MKRKFNLLVILVLAVIMAFQGVVFAEYNDDNGMDKQKQGKKVLVMYNNDSDELQEAKLKGKELKYQKKLNKKNVFVMDADEAAIEEFKQDANVKFVEEDAEVRKLDDKITWNIDSIRATELHERGYYGEGVNVAIFDTGIDLDNSELNVVGGVSFIEGVDSYDDDNGHGTAMAGILCAQENNEGLLGVAPRINVYSVKVLDSEGKGNYSNIIEGLQWAVENDIDIIAMSLGGTQYSAILKDAISDAYENGILIVAAAGNDGSADLLNYPANYTQVVCVGAVDSNNKIASFSNRGKGLDLVAPGVDIETIGLDNTTVNVSGTSAAVQHVAGVAAQLWNAKRELTNTQMRALLYKSAINLGGRKVYGWGIVDADAALLDIDSDLSMPRDYAPPIEDTPVDVGGDGEVSTQAVIIGDQRQTIELGQGVTVRLRFDTYHPECEITVTNEYTGTVTRRNTIPVQGGVITNYYCSASAFPVEAIYTIRFHCTDVDEQWDTEFYITVVSPDDDEDPPADDDHGNDFDDATRVSVGSTTSGRIEEPGDVDYFKFTASSSGTYIIKTTGSSDTCGVLFNSSGNDIADDDDSGTGYNFYIEEYLSSGTYYIEVSHYGDDTGSYSLSVTKEGSTPSDDHGDTTATATNLALNTNVSGVINYEGDKDFFRFVTQAGGTHIIGTTSDIDTFGILYDRYGNQLTYEDDYDGDYDFRISYNLQAGETYYISVLHYGDNGTGDYTIRVVAPTPSLTITSGPSSSSVTQNSAVISWNTNINSNSIVEYGTTTSLGQSKSNATLTTAHSISLTGLNPGVTYYYRVKSTANGVTATSSIYNFTTGVASDQYEPNNTVTEANGKPALNFNQDYNATIHVNSDVDWYRIEVPSGGGRVTVTLQNIPSGKNYNVELYDGHSDYNFEKGSYNTGNTNESFTHDVEQGRYYVRVFPYNSSYSDPINSYKLRIALHQHTWGSWVNTGDGYNHRRTCTGCGTTETRPHNWNEWEYYSKTYHRHVCTTCNASETEEHSVNDTTGKCYICDALIMSKVVVLIHGVAGSSLEITHDGSVDTYPVPGIKTHDIWAPRLAAIDHDMNMLSCNPDGTSKYNDVSPITPVEDGKNSIFNKYYKHMQESLEAAGYVVYCFEYDWRLDNDLNAQKLEEYIDQTGAERVNIVAHSMGGIIASEYIKDGNADKIDKLITLGTPYLGAPKALNVFETGKFFNGWEDLVLSSYFKAISPNMISSYHLLPTEDYFDYNNTYYVKKYMQTEWLAKPYYENLESFDETETFLKSRGWANRNHIDNTYDFHADLDILDTVNSVDSYFIIGDNIPTLGMVLEYDTYYYEGCEDYSFINGDKTVPVISANIGGLIDEDKTYYVNVAHGDLARNSTVIRQVTGILNGDSDKVTGVRSEPIKANYIKLTADCPVELHVYDKDGNHLGPIEGGNIDENIDSSNYYIIGDKKIAVLNDGDYEVRIIGTGNGTMNYKVEDFDENNNLVGRVSFENVPITAEMKILSDTDMENGITMNVDFNDDNVIDKVIQPTIALDEEQTGDTTAPTAVSSLDGLAGTNNWFRSSVSVNITAEDDSSGVNKIEYRVNNGQVIKYTDEFDVTEDGINMLYFIPYDNNGNQNDAYVNEIKIDKTIPDISITVPQNPKYDDKYSLSFNVVDSTSGIAQTTATINGKPAALGEVISLPLGDTVIKVTCTDNAGNVAEKVETIHVTDDASPVTSILLGGTEGQNGWYTSNVNVTLSASDEGGSGVKQIIYKLDGTEFNYTQPFEVSKEGVTRLEVYAVDGYDNKEEIRSYDIKIDKSKSDIAVNLESQEWTNRDVTVEINGTDPVSGVAKVEYSWSLSQTAAGTWNLAVNGAATHNMAGEWYLHVRIFDEAGNVSEKVFGQYQIDKAAPTASANPENTEWQREDISVIPSASDDSSGILHVKYAWSNSVDIPSVWNEFTGDTLLQGNDGEWYLHIMMQDIAGNIATTHFGPYRCDKTSPEISADIDSKEWTNNAIIVKPNVKDTHSGTSLIEYSWSLSESTPGVFELLGEDGVVQSQPGIWYLHINAQDKVGNISSRNFGPYRIDKTAPTVSAVPENRDWGNTDVSVVPVYEDEGGSQVAIKQYFWSKEEAVPSQWNDCSAETISHDIDGIWYLHLRVVDAAGNETITKYGVYKLDKTAPTTKAVPTGREWSNTEVSVQAEYNDIGGSELLEMQYGWSMDENAPAEWIDYIGLEITQTEEGSWYLYLRASDKAGNITVDRYGPYQIDKTAPVISVPAESMDWSNKDIEIEPSYADDNGSGIGSAVYAWSMDESVPEQWNTYNSGVVVQGEEGIWYLHLRAVDKAGNETTVMHGPYKIDKTAPQTSASIEERDWEAADIEVVPEYSDEGGSELDKLQYAWSLEEEAPSQWEDYTGDSMIQQEDGVWYLYLRAVDNAGNETVNKYGQYKVDKSAPEIKADPSDMDWVNKDIAVMPGVTDILSGVCDMSYTWSESEAEPEEWLEYNGEELSVTDTGTWYLHFKASDNVGNEGTAVFGPYRIDKIIPTVMAEPESTEWTNQNAVVIPAYEDEGGSELGSIQYSWSEDENNPGTWEDSDGSDIEQGRDGIWYLFLKAVDGALNEATSMFGPYKVDQTMPEITYEFYDEYTYGDSIVLEFEASDSLSGISETYVYFYGERYENGDEVILEIPGVHEIEMIAVDVAGNELKEIKEIEIIVPAEVDIDPDVINLKNLDKGNGDVTVYIEFPDGLSVYDIELDTILLNDEVVPVTDDKYGYVKNPVSDYDDDGIEEFMVKFEKDSLIDILEEGENEITISGRAGDYRFIWSGTLEAKNPGKGKNN